MNWASGFKVKLIRIKYSWGSSSWAALAHLKCWAVLHGRGCPTGQHTPRECGHFPKSFQPKLQCWDLESRKSYPGTHTVPRLWVTCSCPPFQPQLASGSSLLPKRFLSWQLFLSPIDVCTASLLAWNAYSPTEWFLFLLLPLQPKCHCSPSASCPPEIKWVLPVMN